LNFKEFILIFPSLIRSEGDFLNLFSILNLIFIIFRMILQNLCYLIFNSRKEVTSKWVSNWKFNLLIIISLEVSMWQNSSCKSTLRLVMWYWFKWVGEWLWQKLLWFNCLFVENAQSQSWRVNHSIPRRFQTIFSAKKTLYIEFHNHKFIKLTCNKDYLC
jgi:hypothetical protein